MPIMQAKVLELVLKSQLNSANPIQDSFSSAHLFASCPLVLLSVSLNEISKKAERSDKAILYSNQCYKSVPPKASSSVSTSVIYLKSMHDTICLGS